MKGPIGFLILCLWTLSSSAAGGADVSDYLSHLNARMGEGHIINPRSKEALTSFPCRIDVDRNKSSTGYKISVRRVGKSQGPFSFGSSDGSELTFNIKPATSRGEIQTMYPVPSPTGKKLKLYHRYQTLYGQVHQNVIIEKSVVKIRTETIYRNRAELVYTSCHI